MKKILKRLIIILSFFCFANIFPMKLSDGNKLTVKFLQYMQEVVKNEKKVRGFLSKRTKKICFELVKMPFRLEVYCPEEIRVEIRKLKKEIAFEISLEALNLGSSV